MNIDINKLEERHQNNIKLITKEKSNRSILFEFVSYFNEILKLDNKLISEAYISESLHFLIPLLANYSPNGIPPSKTHELIDQLNLIKEFSATDKQKRIIVREIERIEVQLTKLEEILSGKNNKVEWSSDISFPLIEKTSLKKFDIGSIDTFSIILSADHHKESDEFLVVPSLPTLDKKFEDQLHNSWTYAKKYISESTNKHFPKFKIVVQFNNKLGIYEGDSHGIALTLVLISELSNYLKLRQSFKINNLVLTTGIVNQNGKIKEISNKIIEQKTKIAFYSPFNILVVPSKDYPYAMEVLEEEKKKYKTRNLRILPADHIDDVINRRDIAMIKKQSIIEYSKTKIKKHSLIIVVHSLLLLSLLWIGKEIIFEEKHYSSNNGQEHFLEYITAETAYDPNKLASIENDYSILHCSFDGEILNEENDSFSAIFSNIATTENRFREKNKALYLDGFNSFIALKDNKLLKPNFPISISVWFKKMDNKQGWLFSNNIDKYNYHGMFLGFGDGNLLSLHFGNGEKIGALSSRRSIYTLDPIKLGRWYHLVAEINSPNDMNLYLNNKLLNVVYSGEAEEMVYNDGNICFGMHHNWYNQTARHFKGIIDDFRFYNRPLTTDEIDKLFHEK